MNDQINNYFGERSIIVFMAGGGSSKERINWLGDLYGCSYSDFLSYTRQKKNKTYILKPENGCQGKGIWLTKSPKDIKPQEHMLCQQYLSKVSS